MQGRGLLLEKSARARRLGLRPPRCGELVVKALRLVSRLREATGELLLPRTRRIHGFASRLVPLAHGCEPDGRPSPGLRRALLLLAPATERLLSVDHGQPAGGRLRRGPCLALHELRHLPAERSIGASEPIRLQGTDLQLGREPRALLVEPIAVLLGCELLEAKTLLLLLHCVRLTSQPIEALPIRGEALLPGGALGLGCFELALEPTQLTASSEQDLLQWRLAAARDRPQCVDGL